MKAKCSIPGKNPSPRLYASAVLPIKMYRVPDFLSFPNRQLPTHISLEPFFPSPVPSTSPAPLVTPAKAVRKHPLKPGRHISKENQVLRQFLRTEETRAALQTPKLENIRYRVLRAFKKAMSRMLTKRNVGWKGLLDFRGRMQVGQQEMETFREYLLSHMPMLTGVSELSAEPQADQSKAKQDCRFRTYNSAYLCSIFSASETRVAYRLYLKLVFCEESPESLVRRFKMTCCRGKVHRDQCRGKWATFRQLLEEYLGAKVVEGGEASRSVDTLEETRNQ